MKRFIRYTFPALTLLLFCSGLAAGQVTISGPTCVVPGTLYQYIINGTWNSSSTMHVCLTSGRLADSSNGSSCTASGRPFNRVLVIWNDSAANTGSLSLTSSLGNSTINVSFAPPLQPGSIDSVSAIQMVGYDSVPALVITCGPDSGGSCAPVYKYQWQQSTDRVSWQDIPSARGQNFRISSPATRSTYYRRKVTEVSSGSVGYSNEASVFLTINAALPDSIRQTIADSAHTTTSNHFSKRRESCPICMPTFGPVGADEALPAPSRLFFRKPYEPLFHA